MTELETMKVARELISDPTRWCQGRFARDEDGHGVFHGSVNAVSFCAAGALWRVNPTCGLSSLYRFLPKGVDLTEFNDTRAHANVLDLFDRAIAYAEQTEDAQEQHPKAATPEQTVLQ